MAVKAFLLSVKTIQTLGPNSGASQEAKVSLQLYKYK